MRPKEKEAVTHAIGVARRRLAQLDSKKEPLTRAEEFERAMTVATIERGERLLNGE